MTDAELKKLLQAAPVPERAPEFWGRLPERINARLHWQSRRIERVNLPSRPRAGAVWGWGFAGAAVLILAGFLLGSWPSNRQSMALLQNEKLLREVLATFPNQVRAIIQDESGLHLSLADEANVAQSQPLWIKVCEGGRCRSIVTFSGQSLQIAGQLVEVLATDGDGVLLVGEQFCWSSSETGARAQMRITAKAIGRVL